MKFVAKTANEDYHKRGRNTQWTFAGKKAQTNEILLGRKSEGSWVIFRWVTRSSMSLSYIRAIAFVATSVDATPIHNENISKIQELNPKEILLKNINAQVTEAFPLLS